MEENKYHQLCVWEGVIVPKEDEDYFVKFFADLGYRVKFEANVETLPDMDGQGNPVADTGGRLDAFFYIHDDDVLRFAVGRFKIGAIRWWEDVLLNGNGCLYADEFLEAHPHDGNKAIETKEENKMSKLEQFLSDLDCVCTMCDSELHADYSGRGMYGEECYAIYYDIKSDPWRIAKELEGEEREAFITLMCCAEYDNMGTGWVAYFPNVELENLFD